jgi:hypothetical protein
MRSKLRIRLNEKEVAEGLRTTFNAPGRATAEVWLIELTKKIKKYENPAFSLSPLVKSPYPFR